MGKENESRKKHVPEEILEKGPDVVAAVLDTTGVSIMILDRQGRIVHFNQACERATGYSLDEVKEKPIWDLLLIPEEAERVRVVFARLRAGDFPNEYENHWCKGGDLRLIAWSNTVLLDKGGSVDYVIGMGFDTSERKRAEAAEREQRALAGALCDMATAFNSTLSFDEVLDRVLACVGRVMPHDTASISLIESGIAHIVRCRGYTERGLKDWAMSLRFPIANFPNLRQATKTGQPFVIPDTRDYPDWVELPETRWIRSRADAPIGLKGQIIGFLSLASATPGFFTSFHGATLQAFAHQAAIALENARLFEQVNAAGVRMRRLTQQVVSAQEEERRRLSRELHDEAGQALTALKIDLELIQADLPVKLGSLRQRLSEAVALTDTTMEQIRLLAQGLRPPALDAVGLNATLEGLCRDFAKRTQLSIDYLGEELPVLPDSINICIYRLLQEALTNVAKHACANQVRVALNGGDRAINLLIEDDGRGFNLESRMLAMNKTPSIGLLGMQERLEMSGGRLEILSSPGQGTRLTARIPWPQVP